MICIALMTAGNLCISVLLDIIPGLPQCHVAPPEIQSE